MFTRNIDYMTDGRTPDRHVVNNVRFGILEATKSDVEYRVKQFNKFYETIPTGKWTYNYHIKSSHFDRNFVSTVNCFSCRNVSVHLIGGYHRSLFSNSTRNPCVYVSV